MPKTYAPSKTVEVPAIGRVDISYFLPIVNSREFRLLAEKTQLGLVSEVFPGGNHNRLTHSYGVKGVGDMYVEGMHNRGLITERERDQLKRELGVVALTHDIGHPPFSHITECLLRYWEPGKKSAGHKERGIDLVLGVLAEPIRKCRVNPEVVASYLDKNKMTPGKIITDKSIGADKVGYLLQDQHTTGINLNTPVRFQDLGMYVVYNKNPSIGLAIEENGLELARGLQSFYYKMWTQTYLRKHALTAERMIQKAIQTWMEDERIKPENIWSMPEFELKYHLSQSRNLIVRDISDRFAERDTLKAAIAFKRFAHTRLERTNGKSESVVPLPESTINFMASYYEDPRKLSALENRIGKELGLKESEIVVTTPPEPDKLVPNDINVVNKSGGLVGSVFDMYPGDKQQLTDEASSFYTFRIAVPESHRRRVSQAHKDVRAIIEDHIQSNHRG